MTSLRRGGLRALAGGIVGLVAVLALPISPAAAHTTLSSSTPEDGSSMQTLPTEVVLKFTGPVSEPEIEVTASDGTVVSNGDAEALGSTATDPLTTEGPSGTYTIAYRVVSADGHPISGELTFDVQSGPPPGQSVDTASSDGGSGESWIASHVSHIAIAGGGLLVGIVLVGMGLRARA